MFFQLFQFFGDTLMTNDLTNKNLKFLESFNYKRFLTFQPIRTIRLKIPTEKRKYCFDFLIVPFLKFKTIHLQHLYFKT